MQRSSTPIKKLIPEFLTYLEIDKGLAPKSIENYGRFLLKFSHWLDKIHSPALKPHELSDEYIYKYKTFLAREGSSQKSAVPLKKTTQNYYLIALRALLKYFAEKNIASLPADKINLLRDKGDKQVNFLKLDQIEQLLDAPSADGSIIGLRDAAILETFFSTGLRVAELVALDREQIKIKHDTEYLEIAIRGKGGRIRTVYFSPRAVLALRRYLNARNDVDRSLFISFSKNVPAGANRRLSVRSVENIVKKYIKIAGLPIMMSPHSLRHSYATDLLANGVDLRLVQEFLGHRNIATTQVYTHVTNKQLADVHRKFHGGNKLR
jgi:integrase/recombinase XerD